MSPRPMESNLRTPDNRQLVQNNALIPYSSHNQPRTPDTSLPMSLTVSSATSTPPSSIHSRKTPNIGRGYNQPSVYEMAALTTDLDTQIITSKIKEALMAHNIGQKVGIFYILCISIYLSIYRYMMLNLESMCTNLSDLNDIFFSMTMLVSYETKHSTSSLKMG